MDVPINISFGGSREDGATPVIPDKISPNGEDDALSFVREAGWIETRLSALIWFWGKEKAVESAIEFARRKGAWRRFLIIMVHIIIIQAASEKNLRWILDLKKNFYFKVIYAHSH